MIEVKNKKTYKGKGVYIGRPSVLGNPFSHINTKSTIKVESREKAVSEYKEFIHKHIHKVNPISVALTDLLQEYLLTRSLTLICWCDPEACHGHVIRDLIHEYVDGGLEDFF